MDDLTILMEFLNMDITNSDEVFEKFELLPNAQRCGQGLEQFLFVEGNRKNKILLVAHADTIWDSNYVKHTYKKPLIVNENGKIRNKNGGLGADDRAGCAMIYLLREMGHSILITNGEEKGRIGSRWLVSQNQKIADCINKEHQFVVQLDRRNARDFKCYSVGSESFRTYVGDVTGYSEPDRSAFTDIVTICSNICGVNLSIGYYNEHTDKEYLVENEWRNTTNVCRKWLVEHYLPRFDRY